MLGYAASLNSGDFGLIGLAVMGQNLILNAADKGFTVVAFNRTVSKVDRFLDNEAKGITVPLPFATSFMMQLFPSSSIIDSLKPLPFRRQIHRWRPFC